MVEYSKVNVKLSDTQLKKLKTAVKNKTGTTLRMSLKMFDGNDLPHELLETTRQNTKLRDPFNNNISTDLTISKAQISKTIQSGGFLGLLLSKLAGPLMEAPVLFGITAAASAIDAGIQKKIHGSGCPSWSTSRTTTLIILNQKMNDIMEIAQALEDFFFYLGEALEDSNILFKGVTKTIKNETKEQKEKFFKHTIRHFRS